MVRIGCRLEDGVGYASWEEKLWLSVRICQVAMLLEDGGSLEVGTFQTLELASCGCVAAGEALFWL